MPADDPASRTMIRNARDGVDGWIRFDTMMKHLPATSEVIAKNMVDWGGENVRLD